MPTIDSIFSIAIFSYLYVVILIYIVEFCKPQPKLDLSTLRQGSRERKNATEYIYIYIRQDENTILSRSTNFTTTFITTKIFDHPVTILGGTWKAQGSSKILAVS